jgi:HK97 family phage major capsid protein
MSPGNSRASTGKLIDRPTILNEARTVFLSAPKREINKVGFGTRILRNAATEATQSELGGGTSLAAANRSKPTFEKVTLDTKEVIAQVNIPYDVLEDNIERDNFSDTIVAMIAERAALDLEELIILGDTAS